MRYFNPARIRGIRVGKLNEKAIIPERKFPTDAGMDLFALGDYIINSFSSKIIKTGITIEIPPGCFGLIMPKSKNDWLIGGGVVDETYQGEILVKIFNPTSDTIVIREGLAVAQLILVPIVTPVIWEVSKENVHARPSDRGITGGIVEQLVTDQDQNTQFVPKRVE